MAKQFLFAKGRKLAGKRMEIIYDLDAYRAMKALKKQRPDRVLRKPDQAKFKTAN